MITQTKDNHHSGSWINFQIIEDSQIRLKLMIEKIIYKPLRVNIDDTEDATVATGAEITSNIIADNDTHYICVKNTQWKPKPRYNDKKPKIICVNVDEVIVQYPNEEQLEICDYNTQFKDDVNQIGNYKLGDMVKVKGHPFSYYSQAKERYSY